MTVNIDSAQLKILADKLWDTFDKFGIDAQMFTLSVQVPGDFYHTIKENFPNRHPIDMVVESGEEDWNISLNCNPFKPSREI